MTRRTGPLVLVGATLVVIFVVIAGVRMLRSPNEERARRLDARRLRDLSALNAVVETKCRANARCPSRSTRWRWAWSGKV